MVRFTASVSSPTFTAAANPIVRIYPRFLHMIASVLRPSGGWGPWPHQGYVGGSQNVLLATCRHAGLADKNKY
eukprot:2126902-Pyramimonas_sp.AAC.1